MLCGKMCPNSSRMVTPSCHAKQEEAKMIISFHLLLYFLMLFYYRSVVNLIYMVSMDMSSSHTSTHSQTLPFATQSSIINRERKNPRYKGDLCLAYDTMLSQWKHEETFLSPSLNSILYFMSYQSTPC